MKKGYTKILILEIAIILGIIINILFLKKFQITNIANIIMSALAIIFLHILVGLEKDKSLNKIDTLQIIFVYTFIYILLTYFIGIFVGFNRNPYNLEILNIIKNITPLIFLIILQEIFRFNLIKKCDNNKLVLGVMIFIFITFDIMLNIKFYPHNTPIEIFELIGLLILPSIANNIMLTFVSKKAGIYPAILFRIILEGLIFVVPITPDLNIYLQSVLKLILPTVIFIKFNTIYATNKFTKVRRTKLNRILINATVSAMVIVTVILVSGAFKYYAMAIGSNSMKNKISYGDAVVIEKKSEDAILKEGMIIAYQHDRKVIVHRIVKIDNSNNKYLITTKGDNNDEEDNWTVSLNDVIGIVKFKIPYIGLPSIWLNELL